jgi:hypothetical protein
LRPFATLKQIVVLGTLFEQECCRLVSFDGKKSLIRSFPSKVGVRRSCIFLCIVMYSGVFKLQRFTEENPFSCIHTSKHKHRTATMQPQTRTQ